MAIHRVVITVNAENAENIGTIVFYIDTYYIQYIRKYMKVGTRPMGMIPSRLVEDIEMIELHLISGDVLEFNFDTTGISDLIDDFYSVTEYKI